MTSRAPFTHTCAVISCHTDCVYVGVISKNEKTSSVEVYTKISFSSHYVSPIEKLSRALEKAVLYLHEHYTGGYDSLVCVLGASWIKSDTQVFVRDAEAPFHFAKHDAEDVLRLHAESALSHYDVHRGEKGIVLESSITSFLVNGYHSESLNQSNIRRIELSTYVSIAPQSLLNEIQKHYLKLSHTRVHFISAPLAEFSITRDTLHHLSDFMLVRVDDHMTHLSLIRDGILLDTIQTLTGSSCILSNSSSEDKARMRAELRAWAEGDISLSLHPRLARAIQVGGEQWMQSFFDMVKSLNTTHHIVPHVCVVITKKYHFAWIQKVLADDRLSSLLISHRKPHAILFEGDSIGPYIHSKVHRPDSVFLLHGVFIIKSFLSS